MYGFHKTVNITDGSLRQSEKARKGVKPPSMYSHPYFRKNRPDLLWLIQKPTGKSNAKRKRDGNFKDGFDSDDERQFSPAPEGKPPAELGGPGGSQDLTAMPRSELVAVRSELKKLQQQQNIISRMIAQLKEQNEQFYRQATAFQALHDRHENSINAILTFLATFYNRSLDGHAGQNLVNMFSNATQSNQQHGAVVGEYNDNPSGIKSQVQRYVRRQPLLLPGPSTLQPPSGDAVTEPNSERPSMSPPNNDTNASATREKTSSVPPNKSANACNDSTSPVIKDDAPTPNKLHQIPENDEMMSLINSVNATNASTPNTSAPGVDFSSALDHFQNANGNAPLTPQQRDDMLALMATQHSNDTSNNNALISPTPPTMPDLNRLKETQQQLEMLTNMQKQQDEKVQDLHRRLQPLSPNGSIPGLGANDDSYDFTGAPGDFDPNAFINFDDNWDDPNFDFSENVDDNNWDFENTAGNEDVNLDPLSTSTTPVDGGDRLAPPTGDGQGRVESVSSAATSPAATASVQDDPDAGDVEPGTPKKRLRRS